MSERQNYRIICAALVAGLLYFAAWQTSVTAQTAVVTYEFNSTCQTNCSGIGLSAGDSVFASISFLETSIVPNATLTTIDLVAFLINFGDVQIDESSAAGLRFIGDVSADTSIISATIFVTSEAIFPLKGDSFIGPVISNGVPTEWLASTSGNCPDANCFSSTFSNVAKGPTPGISMPLSFVVGLDDPPVAVNDDYIVFANRSLTVTAAEGVLANDSDPEEDPLTAVLITGPTQGSVSLSANGAFTYTPNPKFLGMDSFTYRAQARSLQSNIATVTITVKVVAMPWLYLLLLDD